jgi:hypothetical protein
MPGSGVPAAASELPLWCPLDFEVNAETLATELEWLGENLAWLPQAAATTAQRLERRESDDWSVVPLRAPLGSATRTDPGLPGEEYAATEVLGKLPGFRGLLEHLPCEIMAARLMRLRSRTRVEKHVDRFFGFDYGKVRLHIPVITSERSVMVFGDSDVHWRAGTLWYGDFSKPHTVRNDGHDDRIHLVIDCVLSNDLVALFGNGSRPPCWLRSRTPVEVAAPGQVGLTRRYSVPRGALDWTQSADESLEEPVLFEIAILSDQQLVMRLPSGVDAMLRPVSESEYRLGRMPEEITVHFDGHSAAIIRRARSNMRSWQAALLSDKA